MKPSKSSLPWNERLTIPIDGPFSMNLCDSDGYRIATGYQRIVIGGRGPYIEFSDNDLILESLHIPDDQWYRLSYGLAFYIEWRNHNENVKVYHQRREVDYADYRIGMWYISPFALYGQSGSPLVRNVKKYNYISMFDDEGLHG